jgi:predicted ATPase/DNA-binding winged helix-turn-helix (wHTH) protein
MPQKPVTSIVDDEGTVPIKAAGLPAALLERPESLRKSSDGSRASALLFGPFRLLPTQRLLLEGDKSVRLGSRALDILIVLVERAGDLVSKEELMARVWPTTFVQPTNLTVHIAALRRAIGDGRGGARYLINIPGRGYRFVAPVTVENSHYDPSDSRAVAVRGSRNLPALLTRPIGREKIVRELSARVPQTRLITVVGTGGIGKTTVALAVASELIAAFGYGIHFIDLASLDDPLLVPNALASALGFETQSGIPVPKPVSFLRDKQLLLVFDSCEHVIEAAASLATAVLEGAPNVHILATSREPLHVDGEQVCRLQPLETLDQFTCGVTAADALSSPAVQLFVERAVASSHGFELSDAEAPIVADICSKLDGIPFAIEFAAAQVSSFGLAGVAALLSDRLQCLTSDRRGVLSRHRSLRATLDWSYDWLSEQERAVLRRLSIFAGAFPIEAASAVAGCAGTTSCGIIDCIASLVDKSLLFAEVSDSSTRYRLLNTVRACLLERMIESGEFDEIARRHAEFLRVSVREAKPNGRARRLATGLPMIGSIEN